MKIYLNGDYVDEDNAKVSVFDHGLLYGDGVFEVIVGTASGRLRVLGALLASPQNVERPYWTSIWDAR